AAYSNPGGSADNTSIYIGPGARWAFLRSADGQIELLAVGDLLYRVSIAGGVVDTATNSTKSTTTHGVAFGLGPGIRYWLHPQLAIGTVVGVRGDFLFADKATSKNVSVFVAVPVMGTF